MVRCGVAAAGVQVAQGRRTLRSAAGAAAAFTIVAPWRHCGGAAAALACSSGCCILPCVSAVVCC